MNKKVEKSPAKKLKLRTGDQVVVVAGKDKGKQGRIKSVDCIKQRVTVEDVNMIVKHMRPNPHRGVQGGLVKREASLHVSNVAIVNQESGKADKISFDFDGQGKKIRVYRSDRAPIVKAI